MDCSWSIYSSNILDLRFMPVCAETHNACWCFKISKNIVPFRWIISKKDCVSVVDVGENVRWKLPTSTPKQPEQCRMTQSIAQKKTQQQVYTTLTDSWCCVKHIRHSLRSSNPNRCSRVQVTYELQKEVWVKNFIPWGFLNFFPTAENF